MNLNLSRIAVLIDKSEDRFNLKTVTDWCVLFSTVPGVFGVGAHRLMIDDKGHLFSLDDGWSANLYDVSTPQSVLESVQEVMALMSHQTNWTE